MSKLTEAFEKYDNKKGKRANLVLEKEMIEGTYKDDMVLQRYIKILKQISKIDEEDKADRDELNEINRAEDGDGLSELTGKNCEVTFTKDYIKSNMDGAKFKSDYDSLDKEKEKLRYKYYTEVLEKYYTEKDVKGSTRVKILTE